MGLKLQAGKTFSDQYGNTHGNFVAYVTNTSRELIDKNINVQIHVYISQTALDANKKPVASLSVFIESDQYDSVLTLIKNRARNQNENSDEALYSLLLMKPAWADWEKI